MLEFALIHYEAYVIVLLRIAAFVATSPILSQKNWPNTVKLGLTAFIALLVLPQAKGTIPSVMANPGNFIITALIETLIGALMGYVATMIVSVVSVAGQIFDLQSGLSSATLFDPESGQSSGITGTFQSILFTLYFLGVGGLDGLILTLMNSYRMIPIGHFHWITNFPEFITHLLGVVMSLAIQMAAPLLVALLMTDVTLAMLSRAVPQMNVFVVGAPAKLFIGLSLMAVMMPATIYVFHLVFGQVFFQLDNLVQWMGG